MFVPFLGIVENITCVLFLARRTARKLRYVVAYKMPAYNTELSLLIFLDKFAIYRDFAGLQATLNTDVLLQAAKSIVIGCCAAITTAGSLRTSSALHKNASTGHICREAVSACE